VSYLTRPSCIRPSVAVVSASAALAIRRDMHPGAVACPVKSERH